MTEKSRILPSDASFRQYAGWTARSNMHYKYVHFNGGESMKDLLRAKGIIKDEKQSINILQPKSCPNCRKLNKPDAQFCFKCNFVMTFEAYQKGMQERDRKDQENNELKERMDKMQQVAESNYRSYDDLVEKVYEKAKQEIDEYRKQQEEGDERRRVLYNMLDKELPGWGKKYHNIGGRPLTKEEREKVEQMLEWLRTHPNTDDTDD